MGIGHAADRVARVCVAAEDRAQSRSGEHVGPELLELASVPPVPQHAEADVRAATRHREDPRVPGEQVLLEQDPQPFVVDTFEVLARRVPRPEIARLVGMQLPPHGGPVAVGRDQMARLDRDVACAPHLHTVGADRELFEGRALAHVDTGLGQQREQRGVQSHARATTPA